MSQLPLKNARGKLAENVEALVLEGEQEAEVKLLPLNPMLFFQDIHTSLKESLKKSTRIVLKIAGWFQNHGKIVLTIKTFCGKKSLKMKMLNKPFAKLAKMVMLRWRKFLFRNLMN